MGPSGKVWLAWAVGEDSDADDGAELAFGASRTLSARSETAIAPHLAADTHGRLHLA